MHNLLSITNRCRCINQKLDGSYVRDVARQAYDELWRGRLWSWRRRTGQITQIPDYSTGSILTLTQGASAVTGDSTVWTKAMEGRYLRPSNSNSAADVRDYLITNVASSTALTIRDPYEGASISAATGYSIYEKTYRLPFDFDSLEVPKESSGPLVCGLVSRSEFEAVMPYANATGQSYWLVDAGVSTQALYSTGTVTLTDTSTTVTGSGTTFLAARDTGRRFRIPSRPDAGEFRITTVNSATEIIIDREWPYPTKSGIAYVIDPAGERLVEMYPRPNANTSIQLYYFCTLPPIIRDTDYPLGLPAAYHEVWLKGTMKALRLLDPMEYASAYGELTANDGLSKRGVIKSSPFGGGGGPQKSLLGPNYPPYYPKGYR